MDCSPETPLLPSPFLEDFLFHMMLVIGLLVREGRRREKKDGNKEEGRSVETHTHSAVSSSLESSSRLRRRRRIKCCQYLFVLSFTLGRVKVSSTT
jgi:hypothetical protein